MADKYRSRQITLLFNNSSVLIIIIISIQTFYCRPRKGKQCNAVKL